MLSLSYHYLLSVPFRSFVLAWRLLYVCMRKFFLLYTRIILRAGGRSYVKNIRVYSYLCAIQRDSERERERQFECSVGTYLELVFDYGESNISRNLYHGCIIYSPFPFLLDYSRKTPQPRSHSDVCHQHHIRDREEQRNQRKSTFSVCYENEICNKLVTICSLLDSVLHSISWIFFITALMLSFSSCRSCSIYFSFAMTFSKKIVPVTPNLMRYWFKMLFIEKEFSSLQFFVAFDWAHCSIRFNSYIFDRV